MKSQKAVILMGDIVKSSEAENIEMLWNDFNMTIDRFSSEYGEKLLSPLTITLGDEFQGIVNSLAEGVALMFNLSIALREKNIRCRFVLAYGEIATEVNDAIAHNMMGEGLTAARRLLNDKKNENRFRFIVDNSLLTQALNISGLLLSLMEDSWTRRQLDVAYRMITLGEDTKKIADDLDTIPRVINKIKNQGKINYYSDSVKAIMTLMNEGKDVT